MRNLYDVSGRVLVMLLQIKNHQGVQSSTRREGTGMKQTPDGTSPAVRVNLGRQLGGI